MGIPIVQEVFDGIRWIITFFIDKVPKPLKIFIFLIFLLFFGTVISFALNLFGVHCNDAKEPVKNEWYDISTNLNAIYKKSKIFDDPNLTLQQVQPITRLLDEWCAVHMYNDSGEWIECPLNESANCIYAYYREDCAICNTTYAGVIYTGGISWRHFGDVCFGDAYYKEWSTFDNLFTCNGACKIPEHYKLNHLTGFYDCIDLEYCGENKTVVVETALNQLLKEQNAQRLYQTNIKRNNLDNFILIKCNKNYSPRLTFFGIDIFDYKIWLFLIIIYVMIIMFNHAKK